MRSLAKFIDPFIEEEIKEYFVAYSGGLDSTVLLSEANDLLKQKKTLKLKAIHINHNYSKNSKKWEKHCKDFCKSKDIDLLIFNIDFSKIKGASIEEQLRKKRYEIFEKKLSKGGRLFMGHHEDDNIETLVLRLLRGSGTKGARSIPINRKLGKGDIARPLLSLQKENLNLIAKTKLLKFIHDESNDDNSFDENSPYKPNSPYSASKAASDHLGRAWFKTYGMPIIITNTSNNYGPWQFPEKLIPLTILKCINNEKIPIYGNGEQIRDWIFVDDHSNGILSAIHNGRIGEKYNISSENELMNIDVVKNICTILDRVFPSNNGKYSELISFVNDRPGHDTRYALGNKKIKTLGWEPKVKWQDGLEITIKWYLKNKDFLNKYSGDRLGRS